MLPEKAPEEAVSIDEYLESRRRTMKADDLRAMRRHVGAFKGKADQATDERRTELLRGMRLMLELLGSEGLERQTDPLPDDIAELGVAMHYLLKGFDLIPDSLEGIGLADDEWVVARVLQRHPGLLFASQPPLA